MSSNLGSLAMKQNLQPELTSKEAHEQKIIDGLRELQKKLWRMKTRGGMSMVEASREAVASTLTDIATLAKSGRVAILIGRASYSIHHDCAAVFLLPKKPGKEDRRSS